MTEPSLEAEMLALEPVLHRLPPGALREDIEALLDGSYREVGASGTVYSRAVVLDVVERRYQDGSAPDDGAWSVSEFSVRELGSRCVQVTYLLEQGERLSRRSTIWRRAETGWRAIYHQGTLGAR